MKCDLVIVEVTMTINDGRLLPCLQQTAVEGCDCDKVG